MSLAMRAAIGAAALLLISASSAPAWPGCEVDRVTFTVEGDTLVVDHDAATYNCCFDEVVFSVEWSADTLVVTETEIITEGCACLCCYQLDARVADLPPGETVVTLVWHEYDYPGGQGSYTETVFVPSGSGASPVLEEQMVSDCLDPNPVPFLDTRTWGRVKHGYR